jgi:ketosteroid isomerase-like protein
MSKHREEGPPPRTDDKNDTSGPGSDEEGARAPAAATRASSLTRELTRIEELNFAFYDAFHRRDIARMERLWSRSPYARCVHPGWEPVIGWHEIRQSWVDIFRTMQSIEFELEDVHVEVADKAAWVNLIAHADVRTEDDDNFQTSVVATTIFEKTKDEWTIVLHHSSHFVEDEEIEGEGLDLEDDDLDTDLQGGGSGGGFQPN